MSDCRVLKRASASLSLRLPRGRPPAVGVDSSFFNLTPPSAEAVTPTSEKPVTEIVEQSITVEAKLPEAPAESPVNVETEEKPPEITLENNVEADKKEIPNAETEIINTERVIPVDVEENVAQGTDPFVKAERPDFNPNPHS